MRRLTNFIEVHRSGSHCGSTMVRTVLNGWGLPYSEDLCFGLGSGLGFVYRKYEETGSYFFTGRSDSLLENVAQALGARLEYGRTDNPDAGWQQVKQMIDAGIPVVLDLDRMYLPFLVERNKLDRPYHFGLHNAILVGYDESKDEIYLLDYLWNEVQVVSFAQLRAARNSQDGPVRPENAWKTLIPPAQEREIGLAIHEAIRRNCHRMREPFGFKVGLPGLKPFAKEVRRWRTVQSEAVRMENAYMAFVLFERVGTGGGNFRRIYARFLAEAAKRTGNPALEQGAQLYMDLFRRWREIARLFEEGASDPNAGIFAPDPAVDSLLEELVFLEHQGMAILETALPVGKEGARC
ncbi:MAG TPA: BtrH N-terminal domain-containing protein [Symbiobacteriaceae bacterium]|nr:BtrH N-terminal domain-containing protein [Symbiobacteriaceae bacterium]